MYALFFNYTCMGNTKNDINEKLSFIFNGNWKILFVIEKIGLQADCFK